jgi:hypothetical protein
MKKALGVWMLAVLVGAFAPARGEASAWAEVYAQGRLVAQGTLDQAFRGQVQGQGEVRLTLEGRAYTFATAEAGRTLGEVQVWVNGQAQALARVAAELASAFRGEKNLALFLEGDRVVGLVEVHPKARVSAEGATRVVLIVGGDERTLEVVHAGSAVVDVVVRVDGQARGLLEVAFGGSGQGGTSGGAGGRGGVGIGIGIGIGLGR